MIRQRHRQYRLWAIIIIIVFMTSCGRGCSSRRPTVENNHGNGDSIPVFIDNPVPFCWQRPLEPRKASVQVLVDGSGSMVGFEKSVSPLVNWIQQGISQLQGNTLSIVSSRVCQFSQNYGIGNCTSITQLAPAYEHKGNTNLDEAIRSSNNYDLTYLLTDGVAASGGQGSPGCAAGVDASCVARQLGAFIHAQGSKSEDVSHGLWIVPVLAVYDGKFYTEEPIVPDNFRTEDTINQIRNDIGIETVVQSPRTESGRLVFTYKGPRAMLLIVLSRWADIGRAAVEALWGRARLNGVQQLDQMKGFSSGLACLKPIEVYPGFLEPVQWTSFQESDEPGERRGTIDASFEKGANKATVRLTCPKDGSGESVYRLVGTTSSAGQISGCVPIRLLPAFNFKFRSVRPSDDLEAPNILKTYAQQAGGYTELRLRLACNMSAPRPCRYDPLSVQWTAYMNYAEAADEIVSGKSNHPTQQQIKDISTEHPGREPHRIFAFLQTLEAFYKEVSQDQRSIILGNLDFCHQP